jgi:hypothetical protein
MPHTQPRTLVTARKTIVPGALSMLGQYVVDVAKGLIIIRMALFHQPSERMQQSHQISYFLIGPA